MNTMWGSAPHDVDFLHPDSFNKYCGDFTRWSIDHELTHYIKWGAGIGDHVSAENGESILFFSRNKIFI